jgi:hypothetical protein
MVNYVPPCGQISNYSRVIMNYTDILLYAVFTADHLPVLKKRQEEKGLSVP